jgi:hypothetical protein
MTPSPEGAVTIVDPRHPLFNQTFPLIEITDHLAIGRCCRIWLPCEAERLIPLAVTDRAPRQPIIFPLSIDATSLQQLLQTFKRITSQQMEVGQDGVEKRKGGGGVVTTVDSSEPGSRGESIGARADMVVAKQAATTGSLSSASAGVSASGTKRLPGGGR